MVPRTRRLRRSASTEDTYTWEDTRGVAEVLEQAAARLSGPVDTASVASALEANGVTWAWQLERLDSDDWSQVGASMGLKAAAKAVLSRASPPERELSINFAERSTSIKEGSRTEGGAGGANDGAMEAMAAVPERLRRFLLLPGDDDAPAKPLGDFAALTYALLTLSATDRQFLLLTTCELVALVSGLLLVVPLELMRMSTPTTAGATDGTTATAGLWVLTPSIDDGMDAMACFTFFAFTASAIVSVAIAIMTAVTGWHAHVRFYETLMPLLGLTLAMLIVGMIALCMLLPWKLFHLATSPYPLLGVFLIPVGPLWYALNHLFTRWLRDAAPLELYHIPSSALLYVSLGIGSRVTREKLRPAAEARAAELRAHLRLHMQAAADAV